MNYLSLAAFLTAGLFLQGCVTSSFGGSVENHWNIASSGVSNFDDSKYIRMTNVACGDVILELYQDEYKAKNNLVLINAGVREITNIDDGKALLFRVDKKQYSFSSSDITTNHGMANLGSPLLASHRIPYSTKSFVVSESFVKRAAQADDLRAKLYLLNGESFSGKCSPLNMEEAMKKTAPEYHSYLNEKTLANSNKVAGTNGFKKFIEMSNQSFK